MLQEINCSSLHHKLNCILETHISRRLTCFQRNSLQVIYFFYTTLSWRLKMMCCHCKPAYLEFHTTFTQQTHAVCITENFGGGCSLPGCSQSKSTTRGDPILNYNNFGSNCQIPYFQLYDNYNILLFRPTTGWVLAVWGDLYRKFTKELSERLLIRIFMNQRACTHAACMHSYHAKCKSAHIPYMACTCQ